MDTIGNAQRPGAVTLRPAMDADEPFLRRVYNSTRQEELSVVPWSAEQLAAFLDMQFRAQHTFYHQHFPDAAYDLIVEDGQPIGRLYVDRRPNELNIMDIALLPEYQNRGIGTALIRAVMDEARASSRSVQLHVETFNRARHLYERLGFSSTQVDGVHIRMEWTPAG
jgi:ribosomal protein S18 acetylase RimI-like enzyme